ncbi:MAG TPA: carotenoid biosynthesis protein [Thermomicrobiales bacterium]|nr:carotenoid biosynthesis protein [Thermomicrobiales bacterium]
MKLARLLLIAHLGALLFGLAGLLIALPNPGLWQDDPRAFGIFNFGMTYAGSLHIVLGAAAMFAWGVAALGWRRTTTFFWFAVPISLCSELIGTTSGYPFGNYAYTEFLGYKVAGHVPFSIPLSWFYVGFACYVLGALIADRFKLAPPWAWGVGLGVWFLTVWDLVLDPAMAHADLAVKFWEWSDTGPYFGMPIQNFVGWSATGLVYMGLSRLAWNADLDAARERVPALFPFVVYVANTVFAAALSASVGLWIPILLAVALGIVPAALALRTPARRRVSRAEGQAALPAPSR